MEKVKTLVLLGVIALISGCSTAAGAKLLLPEQFGMEQVKSRLYVERGADAATRNQLLDAISQAKTALESAYGEVQSKPVVNACVTEACYASFGGMGSKAKIYGHYILLSPRGLDWHFLAHEWSHDEMLKRLSWLAWWRLPQWFNEGVAVAVSREPSHSEQHWAYLVEHQIARPSRQQLMSYQTLRQWLDAVNQFGSVQNQARKARGEAEIRPVYTAAGHEVRLWLEQVDYAGLRTLIEGMNEGEDFNQLYSRHL